MSGEISLFDFRGTGVRVIPAEEPGGPLFVASDVVTCLGYRDATNALRILDDDEKGTHEVSTPGGRQTVLVVTESGLYHLIFKSRQPLAVEFRKWVTGSVLPEIRRTGGFAQSDLTSAEFRELVQAEARAVAVRAVQAEFKILRREIEAQDLWTLEEWARRRRVSLTARQRRAIGTALSAVCRGAGLRMGREASEFRRGSSPRTYPRPVLELHFAPLVDRHAPSPQLALVPLSQAVTA